jgi:hypothetical protein
MSKQASKQQEQERVTAVIEVSAPKGLTQEKLGEVVEAGMGKVAILQDERTRKFVEEKLKSASKTNKIERFFHCALCMMELKNGSFGTPTSPRDYADIEAGVYADGIQVWCKRHEVNIADLNMSDEHLKVDTEI